MSDPTAPFLRLLRRRLGRWFWVVISLLVPVFLHEFDHLMIAMTGQLLGEQIASIDTWIGQTWGHDAALWWHNSIVFAGGFALILLLWAAARPDPSAQE